MNGATVKVYSKAKDGEKKLSKNFRVREFACKDGSDPVFVYMPLVDVLQQFRDRVKKAVHINCAYRTPQHNAKVGGTTYSQHLYGMAADIRVDGMAPKELYAIAEDIMPDYGGIGLYSWGIHVDPRPKKTRWKG